MSHPILTSSNAEARYRKLLKEAEAERRYRHLLLIGQRRGKSPDLLRRIGDFLIAAGRALKTQSQSNSAPPAIQAE